MVEMVGMLVPAILISIEKAFNKKEEKRSAKQQGNTILKPCAVTVGLFWRHVCPASIYQIWWHFLSSEAKYCFKRHNNRHEQTKGNIYTL